MTRCRALTVSIVLLCGMGIAPVGATQAVPRAITVTPSTDLIDGQSVSVTGTGFGDTSYFGVFQCAVGLGIDGCEFKHLIFDDGDAFTDTVSLDAVLHTHGGDVIDCRDPAPGCRILVTDESASLATGARAGISFDLDAPLRPAPVLTVDPANDLIDKQLVIVTGSGFQPDDDVVVQACPAGLPEREPTCWNWAELQTDGDGAFTIPYRVEAQVRTSPERAGGEGFPEFPTFDCRDEPCELIATSREDPDDRAEAALAFDPDAALSPERALTITPNDDLEVGDLLEVALVGFTRKGNVDVLVCSTFALDDTSNDVDEGYCDAATGVHLTASTDGAATLTLEAPSEVQGAGRSFDCLADYPPCMVVAIERTGPVTGFGFSFEGEVLHYHRDEVDPPVDPPDPGSPAAPADPAAVSPRFAG